MRPPLHLGAARIDITPQHPIPLAGFAHRHGVFETIHSPLFLRALLFSREDACGASQRALLVSADLFCWGPDLCASVYESLWQRFGISRDAVILHATHNHSGPQTSHSFSPSLGAADDKYIAFLQAALISAVKSACSSSEPVTAELGTGRCRIGINRRKSAGGAMRMAPNSEGPVDPELTVIRFRTPDNAPKALIVHYTCHPTASGANAVCAEFPGLAMACLEQNAPVVAAFIQGCCGDIRPALIRDGEFYRGDPWDAATLGEELVQEVRSVLGDNMRPCAVSALGVAHHLTVLPLAPVPGIEALRQLSQSSGIASEWSRLLLDDPNRLAWSPVLESVRMDLGPDIGLVSFNAEMMVAYGLHLKDFSERRLLPVGYSNGMIGYVPTKTQIEEGGYEPAEAFRYYGNPAPFKTDVERTVLDHIRRVRSL